MLIIMATFFFVEKFVECSFERGRGREVDPPHSQALKKNHYGHFSKNCSHLKSLARELPRLSL